jgi:hypothetical protein
MAISRWLSLSTIVVLLMFSIGCSPSSISNFHFTGDGRKLLIQEDELPSGWKLKELRKNPIPNGDNWTAIYDTTPDSFGTWSEIIHSINIFDSEEEATAFFEEMYTLQRELLIESANLKGSSQEDFTPPQKYSYQSPIAHQFEVLYNYEGSLAGPVVGYRYDAYARYGNVVTWFVPIVEDEEQTNIKAGEANVLPWSEVERLLKLIDKKFQQASSTTK